MNPIVRTMTFVAVAVVSTAVAFTANYLAKPSRLSGPASYGEFFPDFKDTASAVSISIVSFDESLAAVKNFRVINKDGWRITSHNDYPADGQEQLGKAAASLIALKRGSLVTRRSADHEKYGVIDPIDEKNPALKGRGTRITLMQRGDVPLADLIVGKKVEGSEDKRYVRKMGEDAVYKVQSKFDISTKFADWAETDLLKVSGFDLTKLRATRPKINAAGELEGHDVVELTREKSGDPWKLGDLDEATEELNTSELSTMTNTLDDLRLVGVRAKPRDRSGRPLLTSDLRMVVPPEFRQNPDYLAELQQVLLKNLGEKGFFLDKDEEGNRVLVSREGELTAASKDGVTYRLTFGSEFSGTEEEVEIGSKESAAEEKKDGEKKDVEKGDDKGAEASDESDKSKESPAKELKKLGELKRSRYLIVRAEFDESLLGERPVEPVKPEPPPGVEPLGEAKSDDDKKPNAEKKDDGDKKDAQKKDDAKTDPPKSDGKDDPGAKGDDKVTAGDPTKKDSKPADANSDAKPTDAAKKEGSAEKSDKPADAKLEAKSDEKSDVKAEEPKKDPKAEYLDAMKKYDAEKGKFNIDTKAFDAKIETGKQKVNELNDRFNDWYYVISNDSFEKLRLSRSDLVKKKAPAEEKKSDEAADDKK